MTSFRRDSENAPTFFDPSEFDDGIVHFPKDPIREKGGSYSSATSATEKLTPVVSSESHEFVPSYPRAGEEFVTFQDPFSGAREIDFETPMEGELFNDASTWMTSSTLSTKFTNYEMMPNTFGNGPSHRILAPHGFGNGPRRSSSTMNKRPDEVFVTAPQPEFPLGAAEPFSRLESEAVFQGSQNQWWETPFDDEAFDPFGADSASPPPVIDKNEDLDKENLPTQYLPKDYMVATANVGNSTNGPNHSPPFESEHRALHKKAAVNGALLKPSRRTNFATFTNKELADTACTGVAADRNNARSNLDSLFVARASLLAGAKEPMVRYESSNIETNGNRERPGNSNKGTLKFEGRSKPSHNQSTTVPTLHRQTRSKTGIHVSPKEKGVFPSADDVNPPRSNNGPISAAALANGRAHLSKASANATTEDPKVTCAGAPGSFLAERVEETRPQAVFCPPEKPSSASSDRCKASDVKNCTTPPIGKANDSARNNLLQDMLSKRFGQATSKPSDATELPRPSTVPLNKGSEEVEPKLDTESHHVTDDKLAVKDDPKYAKYFKMLKMGLPMGAVKNAMERDGVDSSVMDGDHSLPARQETSGAVPLKDDPKYAKYFKMLKMGLPMGAVKNAMERDGIDASVMDGDHSLPPGQLTSEAVPLKDDPKYTKYFKMLKMGLPMGAVKNAMERDGVDSSVMDKDPAAPPGDAKQATGAFRAVKVPKDKFRRTRIHWETHNTIRSNTMWAMVNRDPDVSELEVDEEEFCSLFQAESKPCTRQPSPSGTTEKGAVKVIDKKRANNGGITLARIKLSYEEIARAVDS